MIVISDISMYCSTSKDYIINGYQPVRKIGKLKLKLKSGNARTEIQVGNLGGGMGNE